MVQRRYQPVQPRDQTMLLPPCLDDYVSKDNPVCALDAFVDTLDLQELEFEHAKANNGIGQPAFDLAQCGSDGAVPGGAAEHQDDCGFSQEQCDGTPGGQPGVRADVPRDGAAGRQSGGD